MDKILTLVGKGVAYLVLLTTATVALFRGAVPTLLGSQSDFGVIGAILVGVLGFLALLWIAGKLLKDFLNTLNS